MNVAPGFIKGNDYLQFSGDLKAIYLLGLYDGMMFAPILAVRNLTRPNRLSECIAHMHATGTQLAAIVDQYMTAHPEQWGYEMNGIAFRAMGGACDKTKQPID